MAKNPDKFTHHNVPDAEIAEIKKETELEGEFDLTIKSNGNGTSELTFTRKKPS
jgi:hypothetical protein